MPAAREAKASDTALPTLAITIRPLTDAKGAITYVAIDMKMSFPGNNAGARHSISVCGAAA